MLNITRRRTTHSNYNMFKSCAINFVRYNCQVMDQNQFNVYLIDKAGELSWQCLQNDQSAIGTLHTGRSDNFGPASGHIHPIGGYNTNYQPNYGYGTNYDRDRYGGYGTSYDRDRDRDRYGGYGTYDRDRHDLGGIGGTYPGGQCLL